MVEVEAIMVGFDSWNREYGRGVQGLCHGAGFSMGMNSMNCAYGCQSEDVLCSSRGNDQASV